MIRSIPRSGPLTRLGRRHRVLPGFGLSVGFTVTYLSLLVLIPLAGLVFQASDLSMSEFIDITTSERARAAYRLSVGASAIAALANGVFGTILAWTLVRYSFPARRLVDAVVDFPLALPTAVAGLTYTSLYVPNGWLGRYFDMFGIKVAYAQLGIVIVLTFIALPFVVRTVQPVIAALDRELEESAATLGANRLQVFRRVIVPALVPSILTGVALGFARAVGEYGSVIFIAGNIPRVTEIAPILVVFQLEEFNYAGASAIAIVLLTISFVTIGAINFLSRWSRHGR